MKKMLWAAAAATAMISTAAFAAVTFDPATGTGFVGKGDVQLAYGWNNKGLQDNHTNVSFSYNSTTETTWTCTKLVTQGNGVTHENVNVRSSETSTQGLVSHIARERNQITGFNITAFNGAVTTTTDGPAAGSCPANPSGFVYDDNAETESSGGGLMVHLNGGTGIPL